MSAQDHVVSFSLEVNVEEAAIEVRRLQTLLYTTLNVVRRLTGDENLIASIDLMQRAIRVANTLRLAYAALLAARVAAGDPIAIAQAGVTIIGTAITVGDFIENDLRGFM